MTAPVHVEPVFETERLAVHPFTHRDASFIVRLLNDPSFRRFVGDRGVRSDADAIRYLEEGPLAMYAKHGHGLWRVTLRGTGEPIGTCGILHRDGYADPDVGYALLPEFRGSGFAREVVVATLEHAKRCYGWTRMLAFIQGDNERSLHLAESLGFRREGRATLPPDFRELCLLVRDESETRCSN